MAEPASLERVLEALETLDAVLDDSVGGPHRDRDQFPGARGATDPFGQFAETKRTLIVYCGWKYGEAGSEAAHRQESQ